jgi:hypothetical protein
MIDMHWTLWIRPVQVQLRPQSVDMSRCSEDKSRSSTSLCVVCTFRCISSPCGVDTSRSSTCLCSVDTFRCSSGPCGVDTSRSRTGLCTVVYTHSGAVKAHLSGNTVMWASNGKAKASKRSLDNGGFYNEVHRTHSIVRKFILK